MINYEKLNESNYDYGKPEVNLRKPKKKPYKREKVNLKPWEIDEEENH